MYSKTGGIIAGYLLVTIASSLPTVDKGLFAVVGVKTCGNGSGYCLLGNDCTLDDDFTADPGGHCNGLRTAFTPSPNFVCCSDVKKTNEVEEGVESQLLEGQNQMEPGQVTTTEEAVIGTTVIQNEALANQKNNSDGIQQQCGYCNSTVVFNRKNSQLLCVGSHIGSGWIVTSAFCAERVFLNGIASTAAHFVDETDESSLSTILVNENYRINSSNLLLPQTNNLGLIQLDNPLPNKCFACLPEKVKKFGGKICTSYRNAADPDSETCESEVETIFSSMSSTSAHSEEEEFLTMTCTSSSAPSEPKSIRDENTSGQPLICDDYLIGVETSSAIGRPVYSQISLYLDWIRHNMNGKAEHSIELNSKKSL